MQQELKSDGFDVTTISVDRVDNRTRLQPQYAYFKTTLYDRRIAVYRNCDFLTEEVLGLERLSDGHIEHPDAGRSGSKDAIDAVVGSLWNASQHAEEYGYNYGEGLDAAFDVNIDGEAKSAADEWTRGFKEGLMQAYADAYAELDAQNDADSATRKAEYERYKDISDGIIII